MPSGSPPYARVILKISGESFAKPGEPGIGRPNMWDKELCPTFWTTSNNEPLQEGIS